ncbi:DNA-directed RNA pol I, largest subunit [Trema orientale]|uniref:DNA-directed RNA polymerase n=1 Tax=Trema orientale TaxID=63057 RepID=A0A2P5DJ08_TREOI|nr:DNA-directed RNA pol I, largest subunit [Trema orientale]
MCPNYGFVYFYYSELISGQLGNATLGIGNNDGLYYVLLRDYDAHAAVACMNRSAKLSARWIGDHGFSIGIDDIQPSQGYRDHKEQLIKRVADECNKKILLYNEGLPVEPGCDAAQSLEEGVTHILNGIPDATEKLYLQELHWRNSSLIMFQCGSRGSLSDIRKIVAYVGQQLVDGRRPPNGFIDRSLPHFTTEDNTLAAKGFVGRSFYEGLPLPEYFFHTLQVQESLSRRKVKSHDVRIMSFWLMKALEDIFVSYDNTVRNAVGCIFQFFYGGDGMDPAHMEGKNGDPLNFERLFMNAEVTSPALEKEKLSQAKVSKIVETKILKNKMTLGASWSVALKVSLKSFFDKNRIQSGVTAHQLETFLDTCICRLRSKKIEPGSPVGVVGAQSIGEAILRMRVEASHFARVGSTITATLGVPHMKEIIGGEKRISAPIITVALLCDDSEDAAQRVRNWIGKASLGPVSNSFLNILMYLK